MKLVIIGAGKVAYYMIRELTREYEIVIVEKIEGVKLIVRKKES